MDIAALVTWLITALGGFYLLGTWIARGGPRRQTHFPAPVIFGHFLLAAAGLVVWIVYVFTDTEALAWIALGLLIPVAVLGLTMFARWLPTYRTRVVRTGPGTATAAELQAPAERYFPVGVVVGHGLFAVVTLVLVLLTTVGVGGS